MGIQDRLRDTLTGGGKTDPPEYHCLACRHRFNSNRSPRNATCPECDSDEVKLLANPDRADGSHPLDPRGDDDSTDDETVERDDNADAPDVEAPDAEAQDPDEEERAAVRELLTTGRYRCRDCREAFDREGDELVCPDCGSTDIKERFD